MNKSPEYNQQQTVPKQLRSEVEESGIMYLPKPGEKTGYCSNFI